MYVKFALTEVAQLSIVVLVILSVCPQDYLLSVWHNFVSLTSVVAAFCCCLHV